MHADWLYSKAKCLCRILTQTHTEFSHADMQLHS